ncbi:MAG: hypothetical protein IPL73_06515 [Candidatus Obscuribacter sp.]|nr:hypothetical protein [Candidatus Obscuribacter sp.]
MSHKPTSRQISNCRLSKLALTLCIACATGIFFQQPFQQTGAAKAATPDTISLDFPNNAVYGWLGTVSWPESIVNRHLKVLKQIPIRGHMSLPANQTYSLHGSGVLCTMPQLIDNIPSNLISAINFDSTELDDAGTKYLKRFTHSLSFSMEGTDTGDSALEVAASMPELKRLVLAHTMISGRNFNLLAKLKKLEYVDISNNMLIPGAMRYFAELTAIKYLDLRRLQLRDNDLSVLKNMPNLTRLRLSENNYLTDKCLETLSALKSLKDVDICSTKITAHALINKMPPKLHNLLIVKGQFSQADIKALLKFRPDLVLTQNDLDSKADPLIFSPLH